MEASLETDSVIPQEPQNIRQAVTVFSEGGGIDRDGKCGKAGSFDKQNFRR
ncbi:MAG: hypothetical protein IJF23_01765 [Clostridia bacterium]|nr:hypothetical protein [Clostridia bacterium]